MTLAPPMLLEARRIMLDGLNMDPGPKPEDLEPNEVGIVGDPSHVGGYHCGEDRIKRDDVGRITDYSVIESTRDRTGLSIYAAAIDIGWFQVRVDGTLHNMYTFNAWLVDECQKNRPDTLDIREIIYTPDGTTIKRWDRLGKRTTGDSSHRTHTHISEFRDARGRNMPGLFQRYLESIGLVDVTTENAVKYIDGRIEAMAAGRDKVGDNPAFLGVGTPVWIVEQVKLIKAAVDDLVARPPATSAPVDIPALVEALKPHLQAAAEEAIREVLGSLDETG